MRLFNKLTMPTRLRVEVAILAVLVVLATVWRLSPGLREAVRRALFPESIYSVASRVADIKARRPELASLVASAGGPIRILVLKRERTVEIHAKGWSAPLSFPMTAFSGQLGPKLREWDGQIPEGVFDCVGLNPNSSFHVSIKVGYPSGRDKEWARKDGRTNLGGDIFLHGRSASIGCIPVGDAAAEEIFLLAAVCGVASEGIVIAPYDMRLGRDDELEATIHAPSWYPELLLLISQYMARPSNT